MDKIMKISQGGDEMTIIGAIEKVIDLVVDSKLSDEFYQQADNYLQYIAERMELTKEQALIFSLFIERSSSYCISISDFARMIDCRIVRIISMMGEADELVKRGLIYRKNNDREVSYRVPQEVIDAVKENRAYLPKPITGLGEEEFYETLLHIFEKRDFENEHSMEEALRELIEGNQQLHICRKIKCLDLPKQSDPLLILCAFIHYFINNDDDCIGTHDWEGYFHRRYVVKDIVAKFKSKRHILIEKSLLEPRNEDGMSDNNYYHLTDYAKGELFPDLTIEIKDSKSSHLISHLSFAEKHLFYNARVQRQVEQLTELLQPQYFKQVQRRLAESGMRKGFACLFYGAPGTGKTETVNQLARLTGRDVMMIDISRIKSCWVGESEKNIKETFDLYRRITAKADVAPILLFNEADAVLGIRQEGAQRAVDKMENSIQNIILQEMEQLDGIMIATTNLTNNLDKAFERRFIYKIEFERPTIAARVAIWQTMIPELDSTIAYSLAQQYDFSGGQIENIARKRAVGLILEGVEPSAEQMHNYCRTEELTSSTMKLRPIGF